MPTARFVDADGVETVLDVPIGRTLKDAALDEPLPGIIGECGGYAVCGTCHVSVAQRYLPLLPAPTEDEEIVLEGLLTPAGATSRLACQIAMTDALDGITVHLPRSQG